MTILEKILAHKRDEVAKRKELYPAKLLEQSVFFPGPCVSLRRYLERDDRVGVIAEIKRKSPSGGDFNRYLSVEKLSIGYMQAGASALSILTDKEFFGGANEDLILARKLNFCPILRKDFTLDEYQVLEAKSIGADAILLIAAALAPAEISRLSATARSLGLEVLLEVHSREELERCPLEAADIVGVNNRDLATFKESLETSFELAERIPPQMMKISESSIRTAGDIKALKSCGYRGFLVGGHFMKSTNPERACARLIEEARAAC